MDKKPIVQRYIQTGVIGPDDVRLIAIGGGRIGRFIPEPQLPLIMSSVFPIGDEFVTIAREHGSVIDRGFLSSLKIERQTGSIPRTAFTDDHFSHVSGVIWSRIGIGNMSRRDRPLTLVHNPCALIPMPQLWGVWDLEFVAKVSEAGWEAENILMHNNA